MGAALGLTPRCMSLAAQVAMAAVAAQQAAAAATSAALVVPVQAPLSVSTGKRKQVAGRTATPLVPTQREAGKHKTAPAPPPALERAVGVARS